MRDARKPGIIQRATKQTKHDKIKSQADDILVSSGRQLFAGAPSLAIAQFDPWQNSRLMQSMSNYWAPNNHQLPTLGQLANNEAVVVDLKGYNIAKAGAKDDTFLPHRQIESSRSGGRWSHSSIRKQLYIVDGKQVASK